MNPIAFLFWGGVAWLAFAHLGPLGLVLTALAWGALEVWVSE